MQLFGASLTQALLATEKYNEIFLSILFPETTLDARSKILMSMFTK